MSNKLETLSDIITGQDTEINKLKRQIGEWESVFGHLSKDPDTAGNMINEQMNKYRTALQTIASIDRLVSLPIPIRIAKEALSETRNMEEI